MKRLTTLALSVLALAGCSRTDSVGPSAACRQQFELRDTAEQTATRMDYLQIQFGYAVDNVRRQYGFQHDWAIISGEYGYNIILVSDAEGEPGGPLSVGPSSITLEAGNREVPVNYDGYLGFTPADILVGTNPDGTPSYGLALVPDTNGVRLHQPGGMTRLVALPAQPLTASQRAALPAPFNDMDNARPIYNDVPGATLGELRAAAVNEYADLSERYSQAMDELDQQLTRNPTRSNRCAVEYETQRNQAALTRS